jgi:hypothetical protein
LDYETKEEKIKFLNETRKMDPKQFKSEYFQKAQDFIDFSPVSPFDFRSSDIESFEIPIGGFFKLI